MARLAALCAVVCAVVLTTGCTVVRYTDTTGRSLWVVDGRLSGSTMGIDVQRTETETIIRINRDQGSPEGSISAVAEALQPVRLP